MGPYGPASLWSMHPGSGNDLVTGPLGAGVQASPLLKVTHILRLTGPQLSPGAGGMFRAHVNGACEARYTNCGLITERAAKLRPE